MLGASCSAHASALSGGLQRQTSSRSEHMPSTSFHAITGAREEAPPHEAAGAACRPGTPIPLPVGR